MEELIKNIKEKFLYSKLSADLQIHRQNHINKRKNVFVNYKPDKLTACFVDRGLAYRDLVSIQAKYPIDEHSTWGYFEIIILELNTEGSISIGWTDSDFPFYKHVGHTSTSYGYQANGNIQTGRRTIQEGLSFKKGDVVGCGLSLLSDVIFFTLNGTVVSTIQIHSKLEKYYPTISFYGPHESAKFNFGAKPFKFNFEKYFEEDITNSITTILEEDLPPNDIHQLIGSYLYVNGYRETLQMFLAATKLKPADIYSLRQGFFEEEPKMEEEKSMPPSPNRINNENDKSQESSQKTSHPSNHSERSPLRREHLRIFFRNIFSNPFRSNLAQRTTAMQLNNPFIATLGLGSSLFSEYDENYSAMIDEFTESNTQVSIPHATLIRHKPKKLQLCENKLSNYETSFEECAFDARANIINKIMSFNIVEVFELISISFSFLFEFLSFIQSLHILQFLQYINTNQFELAIAYAQQHLAQWKDHQVKVSDHANSEELKIEKLFEIFQYTDIMKSPLASFFAPEYRTFVAGTFNKLVLNHRKFEEMSTLEVLLKSQLLIFQKKNE